MAGQYESMPGRPLSRVQRLPIRRFSGVSPCFNRHQALQFLLRPCQDGTLIIKVMVIKDTAELRQRIPDQLEGYAVHIEETGEIRPLDAGN